MYTIKIQVENPNYLAVVGTISFVPSENVLDSILREYAENAMSPVSCIMVYKGKKLVKTL